MLSRVRNGTRRKMPTLGSIRTSFAIVGVSAESHKNQIARQLKLLMVENHDNLFLVLSLFICMSLSQCAPHFPSSHAAQIEVSLLRTIISQAKIRPSSQNSSG